MPKKLLSLYVRIGTVAVRAAFNLTSQAVKLAGNAVGLGGPEAGEWPAAPAGETAPAEERGRPTSPNGAPPPDSEGITDQAERPAPAPPEAPSAQGQETAVDFEAQPPSPLDRAEELAKTVDDEPELVEELAEPGAEEGAGAAVEVDEPWEGYARMNADTVIARIEEAGAEELAVLELYERAHRRRRTVLAAAERRHRAITGQGAP